MSSGEDMLVRCTSCGPPVHSKKFGPDASPAEIAAWARSVCGEPAVEPDIFFDNRAVVPLLAPDCDVEVWYVEQVIEEMGPVGRLLQAYHCGLIFRVSAASGGAPPPLSVFTLQYYAVDFPHGALFPIAVDEATGPRWNNEAVVAFTAGEDLGRWTKGYKLVGCTQGSVVNALGDWILKDYAPSHPGYQVFDCFDAPLAGGSTRKWIDGSFCDTFAHAALEVLPRLGARFTSQEPLYRNYVPLLSLTAPEKVDMGDPAQRAALNKYYSTLLELVTKGLSTRSLPQVLHWLGDRLEYVYIFDSVSGVYQRVLLAPPYLDPSRMYQRMALPWQSGSGNGERPTSLRDLNGGPKPSAMAADELLSGLAVGTKALVLKRGKAEGYAALAAHWKLLAGAATGAVALMAALMAMLMSRVARQGASSPQVARRLALLGVALGFTLGRVSAR